MASKKPNMQSSSNYKLRLELSRKGDSVWVQCFIRSTTQRGKWSKWKKHGKRTEWPFPQDNKVLIEQELVNAWGAVG